IGLRRLIEAAAEETHALAAQPRLHLVVTDAARLAHPLAGCRILHKAAARLGARHDAAGAVHGRVQARRRSGALHTGQDDGVGATSIPSLPPASLRNAVAVLWPKPREPKCTPIQTKPSSSSNRST